AYPESFNRSWNDTRGLSPADDVAFAHALIAELVKTARVDPARVYATGISNGGFFSTRLACELSEEIAAVASVAATMPETLLPVCHPLHPVSVLFMHGTDDRIVPMGGGPILRNRGRAVSLADAVNFWRRVDATAGGPKTSFPDQARDGTSIRCDAYTSGKEGSEVLVYVVEGGGHAWPGGPQYLPKALIGAASQNLNAPRT